MDIGQCECVHYTVKILLIMYCRHYEGFLVLQCIQERLCSARQEHHRSHFCTWQRTAGENIHNFDRRAKKLKWRKQFQARGRFVFLIGEPQKLKWRKQFQARGGFVFLIGEPQKLKWGKQFQARGRFVFPTCRLMAEPVKENPRTSTTFVTEKDLL